MVQALLMLSHVCKMCNYRALNKKALLSSHEKVFQHKRSLHIKITAFLHTYHLNICLKASLLLHNC